MAWLHALYAVGKHFHWVATTSAVLTYYYYLRTFCPWAYLYHSLLLLKYEFTKSCCDWSHTYIVISMGAPSSAKSTSVVISFSQLSHASREWIADGISSVDNVNKWQCPKVCMTHWSGKTRERIAVLRWTTNYQIYNAMYVTVISTLCFIQHLSEI